MRSAILAAAIAAAQAAGLVAADEEETAERLKKRRQVPYTPWGGVTAPTDTTAPTVTITSTESSGSFAQPIPLTFTLDEVATDFAVGDVTVGAGGTIGNFAGSGTSYTADLTVTTALATITVDIAGDAFHDAAGNGNEAATQFSITSGLILVDNFSDSPALSAGAVHGTASNPGPGGNRTVVDTESKVTTDLTQLLIASGKASPGWGDPGIWYASTARAVGKVTMTKHYLANVSAAFSGLAAWDVNQSGDSTYRTGMNAGTITVQDNIMDSGMLATNDLYQAIVQRSAGLFYLGKGGGVISDWQLLWVRNDGTDATLYPAAVNYSKTTIAVDYIRAGLLTGAWSTDTGIATQILSGARSGGDTFVHEANALIYYTVTTLPSSGTIDMQFRIQDATNYWMVSIGSTGVGTLYEVNAGTPTQRGSTTTGITNGTRVGIRCGVNGGNIAINFHKGLAAAATNTSSSSFVTETDGSLSSLGTGGAVTTIEIYPRSISGAALTQLNSLNHATFDGFQVNSATMTNAASRLTIPNGETGGNANQVVHPDVCRPNPAGKWNGYTYWMVIEPYPESDESKENPYILVSDDMETWIEPAGITNPVVAAPGGGVYNNDGDLFYDADTDTMYLVYGVSDGTTYQKINVRSSSDGITWSAATEILNVGLRACLSPAIVKTGAGVFEMYSINATATALCEVRTCATMTGTWSAATTVFNRTPYSDLQQMWHIDVHLEDGNYLALVSIRSTADYFYLASSTDGRRWNIADDPLVYKSASGWDNAWMYRASIGVRTATGFDVIYSAKSNDGLGDWGAGRTQLTIPVV